MTTRSRPAPIAYVTHGLIRARHAVAAGDLDAATGVPRANRFNAAVLAAVGALLLISFAWGTYLDDSRNIGLHAPPLYGVWDVRLGAAVLPALVIAAGAIVYAPLLTLRLRWRTMLWAATAGAAAWAVALAFTDGLSAIADPAASPAGYLRSVPLVGNVGSFLQHFADRIDLYAVHVRSHPPGLVLALAGLTQIGLGGPGVVAALMITGGAATVPAALVALREVAGEAAARRAAPYLVLAPAALWIATTADALYAGVAAWGVALVVVATGRRGRSADGIAVAGGLLLGVSMFLTYGILPLALVPFGVALVRRRMRPLLFAAAGAAVVVAGFALAGFWWLDGLAATNQQYQASVAKSRPYEYFVLANLAAFALSLGPAVVAGLTRLRGRAAWMLPAAGLAAVTFADVSGLSKGEVERIWLVFTPWVLVAACALPSDRRTARAWLGGQAALAIALQVSVRMPW